jgi:hypothetical protein
MVTEGLGGNLPSKELLLDLLGQPLPFTWFVIVALYITRPAKGLPLQCVRKFIEPTYYQSETLPKRDATKARRYQSETYRSD